jgi:DNA polymerase V
VAQVWNIGRATAKTLRKHSISTIEDFVNVDARTVDHLLGIAGRRAQDELLGVLVYTLAANSSDIRQSLASTRSFAKVCADKTLLESAVAYHLTHVAEKLRQKKLAAGALLVELRPSRHGDFAFRGGSFLVPLEVPTNNSAELLKAALRAVSHLYEPRVPYKKAGVTALQLVPESFVQPALFGEGKSLRVQSSVDTVVDQLNRRFGPSTIHAATIVDRGPKTSSSMRSPHYTTAWSDIPTVRAT